MNLDIDTGRDQPDLRTTENACDRHDGGSVASRRRETRFELRESLFDVFKPSTSTLEHFGLSRKFVASEQVEASEISAQHGPKVSFEVMTHVLDGRRHALEQPAGEIIDAKIHGATSFAPY